jgi:hypothetical protein
MKLLQRLAPYKKTVAGFVTPGLVALGVAILPSSPGGSTVTGSEWSTILGAMLATAGIVFKVRNRPKA